MNATVTQLRDALWAACMEAAQATVEKHLADAVDNPDDRQEVYDQAWSLAFDGAWDAGADQLSSEIADAVAFPYLPAGRS